MTCFRGKEILIRYASSDAYFRIDETHPQIVENIFFKQQRKKEQKKNKIQSYMPRNSLASTAKLGNRRHVQKVKGLKFNSILITENRLNLNKKNEFFLADKTKVEAVPESPGN